MQLLLDYWWLVVPIVVEVAWLVLFARLEKRIYPRLALDPRVAPPMDALKSRYVGEYGQPVGPYAWVRRLELAHILYHFPVLVPGCWLSRRDQCPAWAILFFTPLVYVVILYALSR